MDFQTLDLETLDWEDSKKWSETELWLKLDEMQHCLFVWVSDHDCAR